MSGKVGSKVLRLERQVCLTLAVASREVVSLYRPLLEPLGLTHPQYLVMVALWEADEPLSIKQLTRLLTQDAPTLSPLLKRLENAGLVERQRDPVDARSLLVRLTDRGDRLRTRAAEVPDLILSQLGMRFEDLESLRDALSELIDRAQTRGGAPLPGGVDGVEVASPDAGAQPAGAPR